MKDLFTLEGKIIVLTGGRGNLGRVMARHLLDYGSNLFITASSEGQAEGLPAGEKLHYIVCDLRDTAQIAKLFKTVDEAGGLDVLINNAAYGGGAGGKRMTKTRMEDFDDETWAYGIDGTVGVTFRCIREAIPYFRKRGGGSIVNIASMYGVVAPDHSIYGDTGQNSPATYGAGKAGVVQLTRYTASYLAKDNVRVNCITPGPFPKTEGVNPDFLHILQSKTMLGRTGDPDELAGPLILLCSDASSFMTGANILVDGGWTAW